MEICYVCWVPDLTGLHGNKAVSVAAEAVAVMLHHSTSNHSVIVARQLD